MDSSSEIPRIKSLSQLNQAKATKAAKIDKDRQQKPEQEKSQEEKKEAEKDTVELSELARYELNHQVENNTEAEQVTVNENDDDPEGTPGENIDITV